MVSDEANNGLLPRANVLSLFELAGIKCQSTATDIGTMNLFADQRVSERVLHAMILTFLSLKNFRSISLPA